MSAMSTPATSTAWRAKAAQNSWPIPLAAPVTTWLEVEPQLLLLDDPTRGADIGAKAEMHRLILSMATPGAVVLLCSTEADELASVCARVLIFTEGGSPASRRRLAFMPARYWRPSILVG